MNDETVLMPDCIEPMTGQESVWDYPRPPRLERSRRHVRVVFNNVVIADSTRAWRVLETSHPPVFYIPREDVRSDALTNSDNVTFCEFKGTASYWSVTVDGRESKNAAWSYEQPVPDFASIAGHLAFYPSRVDACYVDDERVTPQASDFYGGWMTRDIVGPFKGDPDTRGW